ncbi:MAG: hypothetical protein ACRDM9_06605 [Gaiellaceae bacterium]
MTAVVVILAALLGSSTALAAGPQTVYNDFADNGRLDRAYSSDDLRATLSNATIQGYGKPAVVKPMNAEIQRQLGAQGRLGATQQRGVLPFTGLDLALLVVGGVLLLLLGGGLRRFSRSRT